MFLDDHDIPMYTTSGVAHAEQFLMFSEYGSRSANKFVNGAVARRVLVKQSAAGLLEMVTAATDTVYGVMVEGKPDAQDYFFCHTDCIVNRELLDVATMGITDADLDLLQNSNPRIKFRAKIFTGVE